MRVISIDYYLDSPLINLKSKVPVIRLFGAIGARKALIHVHQIYPYFYIKYTGRMKDLDQYSKTLAKKIDSEMQGILGKRMPVVFAIIPVKGIAYYGYHPDYEVFLKIYLFQPAHVNRTVALIEGSEIQVYEAHIPYLLKFFIDYNISGMDLIEFSFAKFRDYTGDDGRTRWEPELEMHKTSHCSLELDIWPADIMNRYKVKERIHQDQDSTSSGGNEPLLPSLSKIWEVL